MFYEIKSRRCFQIIYCNLFQDKRIYSQEEHVLRNDYKMFEKMHGNSFSHLSQTIKIIGLANV